MHDRARQLLIQLVNAPESLSRNRHFSLFEESRARHLRRRASHLRALRDALLNQEATLERVKSSQYRTMLRLTYASGAVQRTWLSNDELSVLAAAVWPEAPPALRAQFEGEAPPKL